jgi:hypothetical protein
VSYETVDVCVNTQGIRFEATLPVQNAARSIVGLLLALSSCPIMMKLRPMAQYHLPFGGKGHTTFRFLGMYLIAQYLEQIDGKEPDWNLEGLLELFKLIYKTNQSLAKRIRLATEEDATVNSLIFLDTFVHAVELDIEQGLTKLRPVFSVYSENAKLPLAPHCKESD